MEFRDSRNKSSQLPIGLAAFVNVDITEERFRE